jgi:hypothetical protein
VGLEHRHRLAGLDEERLVVAQALQRLEDGVEAFPVARGLADAAVDHQLGGFSATSGSRLFWIMRKALP